MSYWIALLLALIQGITEFLPVSSSGHLVIAQTLLGWKQDNVLFDTVLHLGTAVAIGIIFRRDIAALARGLSSKDRARRRESMRYAAFIIIGSIPAGLAGVFFKRFFERMFLNPRAVALFFLVTAAVLFASARRKKSAAPLNGLNAFLIGIAQAAAIFPGISRSGATIGTALFLGAERKEAGRFSFLLGLPAILGAAVLELGGISATSIPVGILLAAFTVSTVVGTISLKLLLRFINHGKLYYFGFYVLALSLACLIFF